MEDGDEALSDNPEVNEEEEFRSSSPRHRERFERKKCNQRIDELATPQRRMFLALWNDHAHHLPPEKIQYLKQILQQLYAMSPEETAKYFAELRAEARAEAQRQKLKKKLRKYLQEKHNRKLRTRAYNLFKRILKSGIYYAAVTPVPPLVSIRLRYLSDIILEQLCGLRKIEVPNRTNTDACGCFMISVADWIAIAVERLYYSAQLSINEMTDVEKTRETTAETSNQEETYKDLGPPVASSTPRSSLQAPISYKDMGPPVASSTPRGSQLSENNRPPPPVPYYSILEEEPGKSAAQSKKARKNSRSYSQQEIDKLIALSQNIPYNESQYTANGPKMQRRGSRKSYSENTTKRIDSH